LIGTQGVGSKNIYNSAEKPASTTSYTFNSLPLTGATIYVRLTSILNGTGLPDYSFTPQLAPSPPAIPVHSPVQAPLHLVCQHRAGVSATISGSDQGVVPTTFITSA